MSIKVGVAPQTAFACVVIIDDDQCSSVRIKDPFWDKVDPKNDLATIIQETDNRENPKIGPISESSPVFLMKFITNVAQKSSHLEINSNFLSSLDLANYCITYRLGMVL